MTSAGLTLLAEPPARGAGLNQVIGLSIAAVVITAVLLWVGHAHRTHRISWLTRFADWLGEKFNRPSWVALPVLVYTTSIICALFGFIWDVSWHIGNGRDPGPLANPAHYFIIIGLFGVFLAGMIAIVLPFDRPGPAPVRITRSWHAPVGAVLMAGCGLYAMIGFPLDDIWHRIFGQDVTLWGPTHLMMIGGAGLSLFSVLMLDNEGGRALPEPPAERPFVRFLRHLSCGGLLIGLSVYQIEYDFGVEQFRLVLQPMMIAVVAALGLVVARMTLGRGAALVAALFAIALRGGVALIVGPMLGAPTNWFPLYLGPALVVELLGQTPSFKRPIAFGAIAGLGVGTVGLWVESLWIGAVYHYPWPTSIWGEALAMAVPAAVLAGLTRGTDGHGAHRAAPPGPAIGISVVAATVLVIGGAVANGLHIVVPKQDKAAITLTDVPGSPGQRMVSADVLADSARHGRRRSGLGDDPVLAGADGEQPRPGDRPARSSGSGALPIDAAGSGSWGSWKTLLRVQDGYTMTAVPIYEPADDAYPRTRGAGRAVVRPAVRARDHDPAA